MKTLTRDHDGIEYIVKVATTRDAEQQVAWCATDNLGMTRPEASRQAALAARAWAAGESFTLDGYKFTLSAS